LLARATGVTGGPDVVFSKVADRSVFLFNDLELWWERTPQGYEVLEELAAMIHQYAEKCLFLFNMNSHTYRFVNAVLPFEELFLKTIRCEPFTTEELQETILLRHQSSRMRFRYQGTYEENLSQWQKARLFNRFFDASKGNIGVALRYWVTNIRELEGNTLTIGAPEIVSNQAFAQLPPDWLLLLIQFVLHKRLTEEKLRRLAPFAAARLPQTLTALKRVGLLEEDSGVFALNRFTQALLLSYLQENDLI
jgi:hypothetical protein